MKKAECPQDSELSAFAVGNLPRRALERVARHVEQCPTCGAALASVEDAADPLVSVLRRIDDRPENPTPVPMALLESLHAAVALRGAGICSADDPHRIGRFDLLAPLGAGSFGQVFRARDTELDRIVAVKVLRAGRFAGPEDIERFLREARSAARLRHRGIVAVFESGQAPDGTVYLVEEFIEGTTLADRIKSGSLAPSTAAELIAAIGEALAYAHRQGVIHRDVKPSNVLLDADGWPHLTDFGLAKREADETPLTLEGQLLGTPAYMSPEQARGEAKVVDARSDVYSLGVVLYECLTGERPFRGSRRMLILQVLEDEPRPPRRLNDRVPRDLETVCLKAMAKQQSRRYPSADEFAADLRRHLVGEPVRARPVGGAERLQRWCRRNPMPSGLLAAVILGAAFGFWHLSRLSQSLVRSTALEGARQQAEMLDQVNSLYSQAVVRRAEAAGVEVTHDYASRAGAIPLPATLTIDLGRRLAAEGEGGTLVRLYSDHPFRTRTDGGPRDDFEREALAHLRRQPSGEVHRFEEYEGRPVLRYATARRMRESCVACHNAHPDSTKRDWRVGDVRGVLEIIRPLDADVARARSGLRGTFAVVAAVCLTLVALSGLGLAAGRKRREG